MKELLRQGARFGAVGLFATVLHLAAAWVASRWFGLGDYTANFVGFAVSFSFSYFGHFYWTFAQQSDHQRSLIRFMVVAGLGYATTNLIVWLVTDIWERPFEMALIGILLVVPPTTWMISRLWAFTPRT